MNDDGTLTYAFIESIKATYPYYVMRLGGGLLFLVGMLIMVYNVYKTIMSPAETSTDAEKMVKATEVPA